jgi:hypothetical protein
MANGKVGAPLGNKNAKGGFGNKNVKGSFGSASEAIKAFGPRPSAGFLGFSSDRTKFDTRIDNYLGHSENKKPGGLYRIATKRSIKIGGW